MAKKDKMMHYLDKNIFGTVVKVDDIGSEQGYVNVYYIPLQTSWFRKGKTRVLRNIPKDCVYNSLSGSTEHGVEKDCLIIYTDEPNSVVKNIISNNQQRRIEEYKDNVDALKKQVASLKQEANDARSGVNKTLESMKNVSRAGRPDNNVIIPPRRPYEYNQEFNTDLEGDY